MKLYENNGQYLWESDVSEDLKSMTVEELSAIGWSVVEDTPRPVDTETITYDLTVEVIDGILKIVWVERLKNNEELTRESILKQIDSLNALLGVSGVVNLTTVRGIKAATNADINANPAKYIKAITDILVDLIQAVRRSSRVMTESYNSIE